MQRRNTPKAETRGLDPPAYDSSLLPRREMKPSKYFNPNGGIFARQINSFIASNKVAETVANFVLGPCHDFLHARTGVQGCRLAGIIRVCYASLYFYSIFLMTIQMPTLFDPRKGLMPYSISSEGVDDYAYSVFEYAPESSLVMYAMFLLGLSSGVLLLLGIQPRWGAVGCYFFLHNLRAHNSLVWDHEFHMNRMWAFFLIFLPLDHITIRDGFGGLYPRVRQLLNLPPDLRQQQALNLSTSWPMWPFRFWQVYTCLIYMGAAFGKFNSSTWKRGDALAWCWYDEGLGRFYPDFVIELLYNRMLPIKLQTWLSLLIEMLCFVTIWPLKTRKITFVAIVFLHIGIELALLMHIFEYLSVLGWVCFFAYPNDGKSNDESILGNKNDNAMKTAAYNLGWERKKMVETAFAVSILYLLIFNTFPAEEAEELMPAPLAYLVWKFAYPPLYVKQNLQVFIETTGLYSGPYILFNGKPPHSQARLTAVVRFSDGREPFLFQESEWADASYTQREIDYWYDTFEYYLLREDSNTDSIPYYVTFSVGLAERYSNGKINREYGEITIDTDNTVESVSIVVHKRNGSEKPPSPNMSGFASIPREWSYESECRYVFSPDQLQLDGQKRILDMKSLWDYDDDEKLFVQNGCVNYNEADEVLHRKGQYGEPSPDTGDDEGDDGSRSEEEEEEPDLVNKQGQYRPLRNQGGNDEEGGSNEEEGKEGSDDEEGERENESSGDEEGEQGKEGSDDEGERGEEGSGDEEGEQGKEGSGDEEGERGKEGSDDEEAGERGKEGSDDEEAGERGKEGSDDRDGQ